MSNGEIMCKQIKSQGHYQGNSIMDPWGTTETLKNSLLFVVDVWWYLKIRVENNVMFNIKL